MPTRAPSGHIAGASHHSAKLSTETVAEMRALYQRLTKQGRAGMTGGSGRLGYAWFAKRFGCSPSTARDIIKFKTRIAS